MGLTSFKMTEPINVDRTHPKSVLARFEKHMRSLSSILSGPLVHILVSEFEALYGRLVCQKTLGTSLCSILNQP